MLLVYLPLPLPFLLGQSLDAAAADEQDDWSALFHPYTDGVHGCAACRFCTCPAVAGLASPPQWWGLACAVLELT